MPVVMESDIFTVIRINPAQGDNRTAQVSADVSDNSFCITEVRFCKDIETIGIFFVNMGFGVFEGRADMLFHFVKERGLERPAEKGIVEMFNSTPEAIVGETAFRDQAVDMRIPFKGTAKSMKDTDKAWYKVL